MKKRVDVLSVILDDSDDPNGRYFAILCKLVCEDCDLCKKLIFDLLYDTETEHMTNYFVSASLNEPYKFLYETMDGLYVYSCDDNDTKEYINLVNVDDIKKAIVDIIL